MWHNTLNYSQSGLNGSYYKNNINKDRPSGTCSVVAVTILAEYYSRNIRNGSFDDVGTFSYTSEKDIAKGYASYTSGANGRYVYLLNQIALNYNDVY